MFSGGFILARFLFLNLCVSLFTGPINALLPIYVESELQAPPLVSAGLNSVFLILGGLSAVPAGRLCDRWGLKPMFVLGTSGSLLGALLFLQTEPLFLLPLSIGFGLGTGFLVTSGHAYLMHSVPDAQLSSRSAYYFLGMTLGTSLGNFLAGPVVEHFGFATLGEGLLIGLIGLLIAIGRLLPEPERVESPSETSVDPAPALLKRRSVQLILAVRFLPTCYWGTATLLLPLLIFRATDSVAWSASYVSVSLVLAASGQVLIGKWADRVGPKRPTLLSSVGVAVCSGGAGFFTDSLAGLFLFGTGGAVCAWGVSTMLPRLMNAVAGPAEKAQVVGWSHLAWSLAMVTGNLWGGYAVEQHTGLPFFLVFWGCLATVFAFSWLFRELDRTQSKANAETVAPIT